MSDQTPEQTLQALVDARASITTGADGWKAEQYADQRMKHQNWKIVAGKYQDLHICSFGSLYITNEAGRVNCLFVEAAANTDFAEILKAFQDMKAENERLRNKLSWYADQFCEGWCKGDAKACAAIGEDNCSGCPARQALGGTDETN